MRVRIAVVAAVVALGSAGAAMAFTSATPTLNGKVGPGFTISLKDSKGKKVKTLKAGTYKFVITDKADIHTFDLIKKSGGKFHKEITGGNFVGKKTAVIKLTKGNWRYYCAIHPTEIFANFTVN